MGSTPEAQALMTALASLFTVGDRPSVLIRSNSSSLFVLAIHQKTVDSKKKTVIKRYTENELESHGLNTAILNGVIGQVASALT
jgi:hypothetical protein